MNAEVQVETSSGVRTYTGWRAKLIILAMSGVGLAVIGFILLVFIRGLASFF